MSVTNGKRKEIITCKTISIRTRITGKIFSSNSGRYTSASMFPPASLTLTSFLKAFSWRCISQIQKHPGSICFIKHNLSIFREKAAIFPPESDRVAVTKRKAGQNRKAMQWVAPWNKCRVFLISRTYTTLLYRLPAVPDIPV